MNARADLTWMLAGLGVALALAALVSPFASTSPDGLEKVAEDHGFIDHAAETPVWRWSWIPDYAMPGVAHEGLATALAGVVGTALVFALAWAYTRLAVKRKDHSHASGSGRDLPPA